MAIIDHLEVTILVDDELATEFNDEGSSEKPSTTTSTKYIEVKSGARFAFRFTVLPSYQPGEEDGLSFKIFTDGISASGLVCIKDRINPVTGWTDVKNCQYVGSGPDMKKLMFSFADLETRDTCEADLANLKEEYGQLGSLECNVYPVRFIGYVDRANRNYSTRNEEIPEKALKGRAISVATKMDVKPIEGVPAAQVLDTKKIGKHPMATFKFYYRTRAALKSEMIIPRSPSPVDLEETAVEDLTPEEMREIIRRQRERAVKIEDDAPRIKRERPLSSIVPLRPMKTTKTSEGRIVYHLDSDGEEKDEDESTAIEQEREPVEIVDL